MINAVDGFRDVCQPLEYFGDIWQEILLKLYGLGGVEYLAKATEIAPFPVVAECVEDKAVVGISQKFFATEYSL